MKTLIKNGQVYMNRHFEKKDLLLDDRKIAVIGDFLESEDADTAVYDAEGCYVTPGFIDVHTHGGFGVDVNAATQEDYEKIGHFFAKEGTTSWHCSILTDTEEQTDWCIKSSAQSMRYTKLRKCPVPQPSPESIWRDRSWHRSTKGRCPNICFVQRICRC